VPPNVEAIFVPGETFVLNKMELPDWTSPEWIQPADTYTPEELRTDWQKLLNAQASTIVSCHKKMGMIILKHFQPHFWEVEGPTGESISKNWDVPTVRAKALERTIKHTGKTKKAEVRRNIAFLSKAPLPTMYRPVLMKGIVEKLGAKHVLDPCIGWGGRMTGTLCIPGTTFTGCEPNVRTYHGLTQIAETFGISDRATLHCAGAEIILPTLQSGKYDLVLTSPPYFNLEIYTHESTQSIVLYPSWDQWVSNWLEPVIREGIRCLRQGGVSAWSVKDMPKMPLEKEVFRIHEKYGYKLKETYGMISPIRNTPGRAKLSEKTFLFQQVL
jgi:hypothetical protein